LVEQPLTTASDEQAIVTTSHERCECEENIAFDLLHPCAALKGVFLTVQMELLASRA